MNKRLIKESIKVLKGKAEFVLVTQDTTGWKASDEARLKSKDANFDPFYFEKTLKDLAENENVHYIGLQSEFRKHWEQHKRELHDNHWNTDGHKLVASILAAKIAQIMNARVEATQPRQLHTPQR